MKVDELADGGLDGRPRTQELSSSLKIIPYIEHQLQDWTGWTAELATFVELAGLSLEGELDVRAREFEGASAMPDEIPTDGAALLPIFIRACKRGLSVEETARVARRVAEYRWTDLDGPLGLYFLILRATLYKRFGQSSASISTAPTPADYEAYRQNVSMRYPGAAPPQSGAPPTMCAVFDQPKRTVQPVLAVPGVPKSIDEACELFKQHVVAPREFTQLWEEHEKMQRSAHADKRPSQSLYAQMLPFAKSFYTVVVNYILKQGMARQEPAGMRAALSVCNSLVSSSEHVLEQQYILTMLFDLQFHLVAFKYSAHNPILESVLRPGPGSISSSHKRTHSRAASTTDGVRIEQFNSIMLDIMILMVRLVRQAITGRPQRITMIAELPAEALKQLMNLYNDDLWTEVLTIFKFQAPLNGKKWRCMNMEIISAIYMHCPFRLDDDWLTGGDTVSDIRAPALGEESLRALIDIYNSSML